MTRWLALFLCAAFLTMGLTGNASAAVGSGNANVQTASQWCFGLESGGGGAIIQPLVQCFTDTTQGIIPLVTTSFLVNAKADYLPTIGTIFILAIAWFGIRLYLGQIERIKGETIVLALKMAGIMLFLDQAPVFYIDLINILQQLSQTAAQVTTSMHTSGFCASNVSYTGSGAGSGGGGSGSSGWQLGLWQSWDCIFKYLLGFSAAGFATASIASFLIMILLSMGTGIVVFATGLYLIIQLLTTAFRFIHTYLMSVLALSFVFCLGYLFVPLMLFKNTFKYFTKWVSLMFGFMLTPIMMFAFMGMMLVALDIAIFSGQYSVYCKIGGSSYCGTNAGSSGGSGGGYNLFKDITSNVVPQGTSNVVSGNPFMQENFGQIFAFAFGGTPSIQLSDNGGSGVPVYINQVGTGVGGVQGQLTNGFSAVSGSVYNSTYHPEVAPSGFELVRLNMSALASGAGSTCTTTQLGSGSSGFGGSGGSGSAVNTFYNNCPWIEGVLVSLCVAALLTYIMGSLLSFIPKLSSNLSASLQDNIISRGTNFAQSRVFGEQSLKGAVGSLKKEGVNLANQASARNTAGSLTTTRGNK